MIRPEFVRRKLHLIAEDPETLGDSRNICRIGEEELGSESLKRYPARRWVVE